MSRFDFRTRKQLFQKGQIERHKDFKTFKRQYIVRQKSTQRYRFIFVAIAIVLILTIILFSVKAEPNRDASTRLLHPIEFY